MVKVEVAAMLDNIEAVREEIERLGAKFFGFEKEVVLFYKKSRAHDDRSAGPYRNFMERKNVREIITADERGVGVRTGQAVASRVNAIHPGDGLFQRPPGHELGTPRGAGRHEVPDESGNETGENEARIETGRDRREKEDCEH